MAQMKYNQDELDRKVIDFHNLHDMLQQAAKELQIETDGIPSKWGGSAANEFIKLMDQFLLKFNGMNQDLIATADSLSDAGKGFKGLDENRKADLSKMMGSLDLPGL